MAAGERQNQANSQMIYWRGKKVKIEDRLRRRTLCEISNVRSVGERVGAVEWCSDAKCLRQEKEPKPRGFVKEHWWTGVAFLTAPPTFTTHSHHKTMRGQMGLSVYWRESVTRQQWWKHCRTNFRLFFLGRSYDAWWSSRWCVNNFAISFSPSPCRMQSLFLAHCWQESYVYVTAWICPEFPMWDFG